MPRYEGMEDLLQEVRDRLNVGEPEVSRPSSLKPSAYVSRSDGSYALALEHVMIILRELEQLRQSIVSGQPAELRLEQQQDLKALLARTDEEIAGCRAAIDGVKVGP